MGCRHMGAVGIYFAARILLVTHELFDGRLRIVAVTGTTEADFDANDGYDRC